MDVYKLDARVTILFSQAQADALRALAHEKQTSVSGLVRRWVVSEMQSHYIEQTKKTVLVKKEEEND